MWQYITPERTSNAIMQDKRYRGFYFIVEGSKDVTIYSNLTNSKTVRAQPAFGCDRVREVLRILDDRSFTRKIGIVDRDFGSILGLVERSNLYFTDFHDIEVSIFNSLALTKVLTAFCRPQYVEDFENEKGLSVREALFNLAKEIGYLKLANKLNNLGLHFKPKQPEGNHIKYVNFINFTDLSYKGHRKMITSIINYSRNRSVSLKTEQEIEKSFINCKENDYDENQIVNGHDLANILFHFLKKTIKSQNKSLTNPDSIETFLSLAYEKTDFMKTHLYHSLSLASKSHSLCFFN